MTIASPCINVCRMDRRTGLCQGCFRTLDEIAAWASSTDAARQDVLAAVAKRRQEHAPGKEYPKSNQDDGDR